MNIESELVELRMKVLDLESENKSIKNVLLVLNENDSHTKTLLTILWADLKKRNSPDVEKGDIIYG